eukprot:2791516-Rhodomonas_salina.1
MLLGMPIPRRYADAPCCVVLTRGSVASCAVLSYAPAFPLHPQRTPQKKARARVLREAWDGKQGGREEAEGGERESFEARLRGVEERCRWVLGQGDDRDHDDYV